MAKIRPNWQSVVLALLLVLALPPCLLWLRISLAFSFTFISLRPLLLGALFSALAGGVMAARKPRALPLCAVFAWLLWFVIPHDAVPGSMPSLLMGAAVLWGLLSVPALAAFFSSLGRKAAA